MSFGQSDDRPAGHLSRTISTGFLIALVFSALAHGTVEPWSVFVFEAIVLVLLLLWSVKVAADRRLSLTIPAAGWPIVALVVVGLAQSVAFTGSGGRLSSLSKNVGSTRGAVTVLIFLFLGFLIVSAFFATRARLSGLGHFLVIYGLALALFSVVQYLTWSGRFYWIRPTEAPSPFGPFANHNHFAGYMEMLIPLPVALIITRAVRPEVRVLYGFAAAVMGVAAVLSLSRGGIISIAAGMTFLALMSLRVPKRSGRVTRFSPVLSRIAVVCLTVAAITAGIFWLGADPVIKRISQGQTSSDIGSRETFYSSRGWVWFDTIAMIRDNPVLGVGMGAYETAFSLYTKSDGSLRVRQAHNDYLQIVADCGVVGGLLALWFLVVVFRALARGSRSADPLYSALSLGSGAGIFGILVHSVFDFNLQLPSNALLFLVLTAVASHVAAAAKDKDGRTLLPLSRRRTQLEPQRVATASLARGAQ